MIDFHTHPLLVREMVRKYPELERAAREIFFIGNTFQPLETFLLELDVSGLERAVILPIDCTSTRGAPIWTNEQVAELCAMSDRLVGFASVDPHAPEAPDRLTHAVEELGLRGLKLSPVTQDFYPNDRGLAYPLYARAAALGIPVVIHAGLSWEPGARLAYGNPLPIEDVAADFPTLNIVIAHLAWPWVREAVALALKYPNIHLDTAALYYDNPKDFIARTLTHELPLTVFERSLRKQLLFGSNYPRVEIKNMVRAVRALGFSEGALKLIFETNARSLLGELEA
jgi:predicted TIM-barrel fold metal-dependent hydrolase